MIDLTPPLDALIVSINYTLTSIAFILDSLGMGAAWVTLWLTRQLTRVGANMFGELFRAVAPLWILAIAAAIGAFAVYFALRWAAGDLRPTSLSRILLSSLAALYLATSGTFAIQWFDFFRTALGTLVFDASFGAASGISAGGVPGGGSGISMHCDWAPTVDPDLGHCNGLEVAMSLLLVGGEQNLSMSRLPDGFMAEYFPVPLAQVRDRPYAERQELIRKSGEGVLTALNGWPLTLMAFLEAVVTFLFSVATLILFVGLAVIMIFAAFDPLGGAVKAWVDRLISMLVLTGAAYLLMGLCMGFMEALRGNRLMLSGAALLSSWIYLQLLFRASALVAENFSIAAQGMAHIPAPAQAAAGVGLGALKAAGDVGGRVLGAAVGGPLGSMVGGELGRAPADMAGRVLGISAPGLGGLRTVGVAGAYIVNQQEMRRAAAAAGGGTAGAGSAGSGLGGTNGVGGGGGGAGVGSVSVSGAAGGSSAGMSVSGGSGADSAVDPGGVLVDPAEGAAAAPAPYSPILDGVPTWVSGEAVPMLDGLAPAGGALPAVWNPALPAQAVTDRGVPHAAPIWIRGAVTSYERYAYRAGSGRAQDAWDCWRLETGTQAAGHAPEVRALVEAAYTAPSGPMRSRDFGMVLGAAALGRTGDAVQIGAAYGMDAPGSLRFAASAAAVAGHEAAACEESPAGRADPLANADIWASAPPAPEALSSVSAAPVSGVP